MLHQKKKKYNKEWFIDFIKILFEYKIIGSEIYLFKSLKN